VTSDGLLAILKYCLLALLYLFLLRIILLVGKELRGTPEPVPAEPVAPRRGRRRAWRLLVVEPETARGEQHEVDGELTIGRAGGCGVVLADDTFVSQVHARVFERDGEAWVEDLGSTNGTLVNGEATTEARRLRKGDVVQIGQTVLEATR